MIREQANRIAKMALLHFGLKGLKATGSNSMCVPLALAHVSITFGGNRENDTIHHVSGASKTTP